MRNKDLVWWQTGVIYQIYPRSFQDSNRDGIGDLPGITARLDHLVDLGVDAIWISPIYPLPMADFGYDVSDYCSVDPCFGTLAELDELVAEAHTPGLRIILDFVPNHTSDQHAWFVDSRSSRRSPKRDWYVWRDPKPDGSPPTNWLSEFGGPAWTFDEETGQYYYHAYLKEQPDLNWRNPDVQSAMFEALRFWFERGVDGFRVDAIHHLFEDEHLRDNPPNQEWRAGMSPARAVIRTYTMDQPEVHDAIAAMRRVADAYGDRVMIGEAYLPIDRLMAYYGQNLSGFHLPFNFHLLSTPWNPKAIASLVREYEAALPPGGWPNWVLGNHDRSRLVSRLGADQARIAAMLLLTLRGTPTIYQGEEIGMTDVMIPPHRVQDPWERNVPGLGLGRDPVRTPLPWSSGENGDFTEGEPWLPVESDLPGLNVAAQVQDPTSLLSFYRALLRLRRAELALSAGEVAIVEASDAILAYERNHYGRRLLMALNFRGEAATIQVGRANRILLSSNPNRSGTPLQGPSLELHRNEGVVVELA